MTLNELAPHVDLMVIDRHALSSDVHRVAAEAMRRGVAALCVTPVWTSRVVTMLRGSGVRVCTLVGFPSGTNKSTIKAIEATSTIKDGADEIELVPHLPALITRDLDGARAELMEIVRAARATRRDVFIKVIVEAPMLLRLGPDRAEPAIESACRAVRESGCDGVVTSAGIISADTASAVALLKRYGQSLQLKASIVADVQMARAMLAAGADRVGYHETLPE